MSAQEIITISRDVVATEIPSGHRITLFKGTEVTLTQALGGNFTVMTHQGVMSSIGGKDADSLGKETLKIETKKPDGTEKTLEELVWDQMRTCYDPEIPHNIVDLGLIYKCDIKPHEDGGKQVDVQMTLTAPGCGMGDVIKQDVQMKVASLDGVSACNVEVVFEPAWDRSKMSPALRREYM